MTHSVSSHCNYNDNNTNSQKKKTFLSDTIGLHGIIDATKMNSCTNKEYMLNSFP